VVSLGLVVCGYFWIEESEALGNPNFGFGLRGEKLKLSFVSASRAASFVHYWIRVVLITNVATSFSEGYSPLRVKLGRTRHEACPKD
jgi:hypothetical protein